MPAQCPCPCCELYYRLKKLKIAFDPKFNGRGLNDDQIPRLCEFPRGPDQRLRHLTVLLELIRQRLEGEIEAFDDLKKVEREQARIAQSQKRLAALRERVRQARQATLAPGPVGPEGEESKTG